MIDSWEIPRVARIAAGGSRRVSAMPAIGLSGELSQDLGRNALTVEVSGTLYGDEARDEFLKTLQEKFLAGNPVDFVGDIVKESELEQVLIEVFDLEESSSNPDEILYRIRLREYTEPPEPPGLTDDFGAGLDGALDLEADLGLDLLDLPSLPVTIPTVGEILEPLKPAAENLRTAVGQAARVLDPLKDLLG